ncbi:hypothetical protein FOPG_15811 [Fusarium oxysporum f. sp. conglutinans race 2 54008]|uniref:WSC domain-containing protein n=1 Tax=Fusarium oxysporum f. sp. conglutinans race 2 54008 TaxID=1089457 RepID=X0GWR9_FUSOX|nr:hypothetical protein FOPG_15811 [Fusarium oxysporum f. sp. conglutinans race 2 54008]
MRLQLSSIQVVASAVLLPVSQAFSIVTTNDANALASAIFGQGITILQASFSGATVSSGTFDDGPFGIGSGGILTSGAAVGALPNGDHYVNNGAPGSDTYCNANTFNAAILTVDFFLNPTYSGVRVELILASEEEGGSSDPIGIFIGGTQYALDPNGNKITATSPYLAQPIGITPPDSVTSYPGSSPPFWIDILTSGAQTMVIAICDQGDSEWDSALLINAEGCIDCDTDVRLAYVTTTTTLPPGEVTFTSTTKASGTVSGTIRIGVTADETTTTTAEPTTNTTQDFTTTTEEPTATTQETTPTETSTEASSTFTSSEELPDTTTTTLVTSDATKDSSTIAIESTSEIITTTSLDPSTQSTTGAETISTTDTETIRTTGTEAIRTTDTETIKTISTTDTETISTTDTETIRTSDAPIDGTTTSSGYVKTPITSLAVSASTDEPTESLSSDISTQDTAVPKPDITTTAESPEDTTVQQTEPSTDVNPPSSPGSAERTSSSNTITSTAGGIPTPATSTVAASSIMPANLPVIGTFRFFGCLGSPAGYPSFELIGEGPDMTTEECVRIGTGYAYIGIYLRSCYAADTLDFADTVATGRCDILCPGDPGLFCGGVVETSFKFHRGLSHREAPPGILLTLYAQIEAISSSLTTSDVLSAVDVKTDNSLLPTGNPTIPISLSSSTRSLVDSTITVEPSVTMIQSQGRRPIIPPFPTTISFNAGNFTRTEAVVITTITYTVVDPNNPSYLTVTELCTTLRSPPCRHCQYQQPQTVEMTTIKVDCNACGHYGENTIILEVPAGAAVVAPTGGHSVHETHQVQYHEPNPYRQKPHPDESDPHIWQKPRPQNTSPATGNELHEGEGGHKFVQPQTYQGGPTGTRSSHGQGEPAVVTKTEPKPTPVGWNRQPEPPKPTFYRRPGPASTPVALDAPIVVVSGAVAKTMEGMFMAISFMTVFVFFL